MNYPNYTSGNGWAVCKAMNNLCFYFPPLTFESDYRNQLITNIMCVKVRIVFVLWQLSNINTIIYLQQDNKLPKYATLAYYNLGFCFIQYSNLYYYILLCSILFSYNTLYYSHTLYSTLFFFLNFTQIYSFFVYSTRFYLI